MLHRHCPVSSLLRASPPPTRPDLALAGCPLRLPPPSSSVSRAFCVLLRYMPSSIPRRTCRSLLSLASSATLAFPVKGAGRRPHRMFRGLIDRSLVLRPASSRDHLSDPFHRRLRRTRCLLRRFDCYWACDPSQAGLAPAESHKHSRRTPSNNRRAALPAAYRFTERNFHSVRFRKSSTVNLRRSLSDVGRRFSLTAVSRCAV